MMIAADDMTVPAEAVDELTGLAEGLERAVAFLLDGQRYAVPIERVREIQQIVAFSEVPGGGPAVVGMVNLRGEVIPAVDARLLIGMSRLDYDLETPMVICSVEEHPVALIVDEVDDVLELPSGCVRPVPRMHPLAGKLIGVCQRDSELTYLVDLDALLEGAGLMGLGR